MIIKTILLEEYVNFVNNTKEEKKYFKRIVILNAIIIASFLFFVLFKYLKE